MNSQAIGKKKHKPRHISLMIKTGSSPFDWECYQGELSELKEKIAFVVLDKNIGNTGRGFGKLAIENEMGHTCVGLLLGSQKHDSKSKPLLSNVGSKFGDD